jgi:hypothetical protein
VTYGYTPAKERGLKISVHQDEAPEEAGQQTGEVGVQITTQGHSNEVAQADHESGNESSPPPAS